MFSHLPQQFKLNELMQTQLDMCFLLFLNYN